jgi:hypothetical protein
MSGGHFNYQQHNISNIVSDIEEELCNSNSDLSEEDKKVFKEAIQALQIAYIYVQRIDWYLSGDDGQESFHQRLKEELNANKSNKGHDDY